MTARGVITTLVALTLAPPLLVIGIGGAHAGTTPSAGASLGDIPAARLTLYETSAARFGIDWALLAAVGKVECDHGRSRLAGCAPRGSVNAAGATGPMQFLAPTWRSGAALGSVPPPGPPTSDSSQGYATDGDGNGIADAWDAADAIAAAARMLAANGAASDQRDALLAYNHSAAYADEVLAIAAHYDALSARENIGAAADDPVAWAMQWIGSAYVYGGNHDTDPLDPKALPELAVGGDGRSGYFDCSSLTSWAFAKAWGESIGSSAQEQWLQAERTPGVLSGTITPPPGGFQRDDLVWTRSDHEHVGLIAAPGLFLNAPHTGRDVSLDPLAGRVVYAWARYPIDLEAGS